ncbi:replicative DNA helicase, partial [bacterium]|nr:replicative DNA helicase [bacterium]
MGNERIPPQNLEAEQSLIGSILIDQEAMLKIGDIIHAEDFYRDSHRIIFDCVLDLYERHDPIDILTVGNRLEEKGKIQQIGGRAYLVELSNAVPTSAHIVHYAQIVQKKASLRRLIEAATHITKLGYAEESDIDVTLDEAERTLFTVSQNLTKNTFVP